MKARIALICVGSELLRGKINTHASTLARRLASIGLELSSEQTVRDNLPEISHAIGAALARSRVVIVTGGLGPTFDDVTREAAAQACGRKLLLSPGLLKGIREKFRRARHRRIPPANARQAYLLDGAQAIANPVGTAPGQWLWLDTCPEPRALVLLPGPPSEMEPMLEGEVLKRLRAEFSAGAEAEAHLHFVGVPESVIDHKVRPIIKREKEVVFTILAHPGLVDLDVMVEASSSARAHARLEKIVRFIRQKTGQCFYGRDDEFPLEKVVCAAFKKKRATLAVAESCTGGLLAKTLTDVPGSSTYFLAGWVTYANQAKARELGLPKSALTRYGAVSSQVACAMARGARLRAQATYGISITGIAGPGGGTRSKPVGLVYIALATPGSVSAKAFHFSGSRDVIRKRSVLAALDWLRRVGTPRN